MNWGNRREPIFNGEDGGAIEAEDGDDFALDRGVPGDWLLPCRGQLLEAMRLFSTMAGTDTFFATGSRWGDYSATTLDPADDWSFWTVQEYADPAGAFQWLHPWKTVIARIRPNP